MSTDIPAVAGSPVPVGTPLGIKELTAALVRHYKLHEGLYDLFLEYQFALGNFGPNPDQVVPSAVIGLSKLGITRVSQSGPLTVDASVVNRPQPTMRTTRASRAKAT